MRRLRDDLPVVHEPKFGCHYSHKDDRQSHALTWAGWWQSANPEVAMPRWKCVCGNWTEGKARWYRAGELGPLFRGGHPEERPW